MKQAKIFDYIVIGAGSGGLLVAVGLQKLGKDIAVISRNIGGDCTHYGCVPSKNLLHLAKKYRGMADGTQREKLKESALEQVQAMVASFVQEENTLIPQDHYFNGTAEFIDSHTVQVTYPDTTSDVLRFRKKCIIASGSSPVRTQIPGVPEEKIITNEEFFYLPQLPKSITIVGGGPIGAELATACASFGVETYLLAREYLSKEPKLLAERSLSTLQKMGVQYFAARIDRLENKKTILESGVTIPETEYYLVAVGRKSNTQLQLEKAGVAYDEKGIKITHNLQTSTSDIYAIGDCTQSPQFTHVAANHGKFILKKLLVPFAQRRQRAIPRVTFTSPPIASVGELEETKNSKLFVLDFSKLDRAITNYDTDSYGLVLIECGTGRMKGAALYGDFSEDLITIFTLLIDEQIPVLQLSDFIAPYPTYGNIFHSLTVAYMNYLSKNWKQKPLQSLYQIFQYMWK
ncbi:NAD(P)/FAD-dependent oxidoreductase [Candidatus Woesebacteria bacterium]|nr:NAD(P)/FAD-dependent oxidoreductase [Candidatus Woesebacteria bacterium]